MALTVARILKASAALAGITSRQLAELTDIRYSRVERLLLGTTQPREDETARLLMATGADPGFLTEQVLASGSQVVLAALTGRGRCSRPEAYLSPRSCYLTIDKISV